MAEESFAWAIWAAGANAILLFLYVFSVSIAYVLGFYVMNPIVLAALAFLIPYFSFTLLPIFIIVFTALTRRFLIV